jgi:hypothetical protein
VLFGKWNPGGCDGSGIYLIWGKQEIFEEEFHKETSWEAAIWKNGNRSIKMELKIRNR